MMQNYIYKLCKSHMKDQLEIIKMNSDKKIEISIKDAKN